LIHNSKNQSDNDKSDIVFNKVLINPIIQIIIIPIIQYKNNSDNTDSNLIDNSENITLDSDKNDINSEQFQTDVINNRYKI
jgi:hypothetical protein